MISAARKAEYEAAFGPRRLKPVRRQPHETVFMYAARCMIDGDTQDQSDTLERIDYGYENEAQFYRQMFGEHRTMYDFTKPNTAETLAYSYLLADHIMEDMS